jgi:hypothetical protein
MPKKFIGGALLGTLETFQNGMDPNDEIVDQKYCIFLIKIN